jgi:ABC-type molybdate transport system substrate-binding protein
METLMSMGDRVYRQFAACVILATALSPRVFTASAVELKVLAPNAMTEALAEIAPRFESSLRDA